MSSRSFRRRVGGTVQGLLGACLLCLVALGAGAQEAREPSLLRASDADMESLGWDPAGLERVFVFAASLGSDSLLIVTDGQFVAAMGELNRRYNVHSVRKAILSALVGQHLGGGSRQVDLDASLAQLGIDDSPDPLTPLQREATVLHLLKSTSGINHPAAAEGGLTAEKNRRLGTRENQPGSIWAYNNWDYNALTTIFETRTGLSVAEAFERGLAGPLGMEDFSADDVSYRAAPERSRHRAAMFRLSSRDLARLGQLYLDGGLWDSERLLPASWIERITTDASETGEGGLRGAHGYLWWIPAEESGLPPGTFWAWGLGQQALFVIPAWRSVIVHQADTTAFVERWLALQTRDGLAAEAALERLVLGCILAGDATDAFCREDRFILPREFDELLSLIVAARLR